MAEIMIPGYIESEKLRVTGIIPQLMQERFEKKVSEFSEFYLQKGVSYINKYINSFDNHPIRRFIANNIMCNTSAKYNGAKLALEKLTMGALN
jgi:hypothetical protein